MLRNTNLSDNSTHKQCLILDKIIRYSAYSNLINRFSFTFLSFFLFFGLQAQTVLYTESMYNGAGGASGDAISTHETNNRFNEDGLTYSGTGDMRTTSASTGYTGATGTWNVLLNASGETFVMSGVNLSSCSSSIIVYFGLRKATTAGDGSTVVLEYSENGTAGPWTATTRAALPTGSGTAIWYLTSTTSVIPSTANAFRWRSTDANQNNIDDIRIECITGSINTGAVTGAAFDVDCTTGDNGTVDFTSAGTFNAGNVYTAQLSSSTGSFAVPTSIGTLSSTANSGTINITIPAAMVSGAGYKIRVVSSDPVVTGTESAAFTITLSGGPCGGGGILFTETFDEAANSVSGTDNVGGVPWNVTCPGALDANDYSKVVSGVLETRDSNGPATFSTGSIDVSSCTDSYYVKFSITSSGDMEPCRVAAALNEIDFVALELNIDGAGWTSSPGSYDCGATDAYNNTSTVYSTDAANSSFDYNSGCIPAASSLELKIVTQNWAADEYWRIDNVEVGCISCNLPVQLLYFEASCNEQGEVEFNWQTASEKDNDYFVLQKTSDGIQFEDISQIDGNGNSTLENSYQVTLINNRLDQSYFRLKQVDFNGKTSYSAAISPTCSYEKGEIRIFPNPSYGEFIISGYEKNAQFEIYNNVGKQIDTISSVSYSSIINLSDQAEGVYYIRVISDFSLETLKVQIIK